MTRPGHTQLEKRWFELCQRLAPHATTTTIREQFENIYHRYRLLPYHNLEHVAACLGELDEHRSGAHHPDQLEFALWLHDLIYDPTRRDNEARSADVAAKMAAELGLPADWIESCRSLILATRHNEAPEIADQQLIADIDLAILAAPPNEYDRYRHAIRAEYAFASDADFRTGRAKFLQKMLDGPHIFHTAHFRAVAEAAARTNLRRELAELESHDAPP